MAELNKSLDPASLSFLPKTQDLFFTGSGISEPGAWRDWMDDKLDANRRDSAPKSDAHDGERPMEEGQEFPDLIGGAASTGTVGESGFPVSSPIFEELATKEARQKRLDFLSAALATVETEASQVAQEEPEIRNPKREIERVHNEFSGYAELGMSNTPEDILELPKLHPNRSFQPGFTYLPQELSPLSETSSSRRRFYQRPTTTYKNEDAMKKCDFKNLKFLNNFVTDVGRLLPRRETKLKARVHRHVMRQVKIARQMALLPYQNRRTEFQRGQRRRLDSREMNLQQQYSEQTGQQVGP